VEREVSGEPKETASQRAWSWAIPCAAQRWSLGNRTAEAVMIWLLAAGHFSVG